jgi:hypothetical protein
MENEAEQIDIADMQCWKKPPSVRVKNLYKETS